MRFVVVIAVVAAEVVVVLVVGVFVCRRWLAVVVVGCHGD